MRPAFSSLALAAAVSLAALSPNAGSAANAPLALQSQLCSNTLPMGLLPPAGGFTTGCARHFTLKLGASIGPDGNYILLGYPACASGACAGLTGGAAIQCQAANGYACCLASGQVVATVPGTNVGSLQSGLNQRIALDTDTRAGICFADYAGNGSRVVNAPLITLLSANTQASLDSFVTLFVVSPPAGTLQSTTVTVEFLDLNATPARGQTWGRIQLLYR